MRLSDKTQERLVNYFVIYPIAFGVIGYVVLMAIIRPLETGIWVALGIACLPLMREKKRR